MSEKDEKTPTKKPHGHLLINDWSELARIEGELAGMALGLDHTKGDVNWPELVKSLNENSERIAKIRERNKPVFNKPNHG